MNMDDERYWTTIAHCFNEIKIIVLSLTIGQSLKRWEKNSELKKSVKSLPLLVLQYQYRQYWLNTNTQYQV